PVNVQEESPAHIESLPIRSTGSGFIHFNRTRLTEGAYETYFLLDFHSRGLRVLDRFRTSSHKPPISHPPWRIPPPHLLAPVNNLPLPRIVNSVRPMSPV